MARSRIRAFTLNVSVQKIDTVIRSNRDENGVDRDHHGEHAKKIAYMGKLSERSISCTCGAVEFTLRGVSFLSVACYCDTCQEGSRRIEALPNASSVCEPDGGTAYVLFRKDRVTCARGSELLQDYRLDQYPTTSRVVASCCNTPLMMRFDDVRHWVPLYRARLGTNAPAIQVRICTKFAPDKSLIPNNVPSYEEYAPALIIKLLASRIAMLFGS